MSGRIIYQLAEEPRVPSRATCLLFAALGAGSEALRIQLVRSALGQLDPDMLELADEVAAQAREARA